MTRGAIPFLPRLHDILAAAVLALASLALLRVGTPGPRTVTLQLGPNTRSYGTGFAPMYEIEDLDAVRWSSHNARLELPLTVSGGPVTLSYRFSRSLMETGVVDVGWAGRLVDHFSYRGAAFQVREVALGALPPTPVAVSFDVDSHDRRDLGLKLDWVRLEVGAQGRLSLRGAPLVLAGALLVWLFVVCRLAGQPPGLAFALSLPWLGGLLVWARLDPFGLAHVLSKLWLVLVMLSLVALLALARTPARRWVVPVFVAGLLLKGALLFHPTSYYPDFANARRYIVSLLETEGRLAERGVAVQIEHNVAYPRSVAGKPYAFPYSPLGYLPYGVARDRESIEDAFRYGTLAFAALQALLVFALARAAALALAPGAPRAEARQDTYTGVTAAMLAVSLPPVTSRMLLAMGATLTGHLLDLCLIAAAVLVLRYPKRRGYWLMVGLAATASLLSYVTSLFTVGAFLLVLSLLERKLAWRFLAILTAGATLTVLWLYGPFLRAFFGEILPAVLDGARVVGTGKGPGGLWPALARIPIFYGWVYPVLATIGFLVLRRAAAGPARTVLSAYLLAFVLLLSLRAFGGGLFQDLKEITFVAPLVAVLSGLVVERLRDREPGGRWLAAALSLGLVSWGLWRSWQFFESYTSPFMLARGA